MSYESLASDVLAYLDRAGVERSVVVGHSMGGKVAMQLALSQPDRVSELVVVDIAPITYTPGQNGGKDPATAVRAMQRIDLANVSERAEVNAALEVGGVASEAVRQFVMTNLRRGSGGEYEWKVNLAALEDGFPEIMDFPEQGGRVFRGRTCLIRGGKSKYVPFESMRAVTGLFPNTKLVTIAEAGHWLQAQAPDDFCRAVNDFLGD